MTDPFDPSAWPSYPIGPRDSVFALGVASVNYAVLEFALGGIFAAVTGLTMNAASVLLSNINNHLRLRVIREALSVIVWPTPAVKEGISHFIDGFNILAKNRNLLMHSNLIAGVEDQIALYKSSRGTGKTILTQIDPAELRRVADDMMKYTEYGLALANVIALPSRQIATAILLPKPPSPYKLEYSSQPIKSGNRRRRQVKPPIKGKTEPSGGSLPTHE